MDEILKAAIENIEEAHDMDSSLAGHMIVIALISERLDRAFRVKDQCKLLEYEHKHQRYARQASDGGSPARRCPELAA